MDSIREFNNENSDVRKKYLEISATRDDIINLIYYKDLGGFEKIMGTKIDRLKDREIEPLRDEDIIEASYFLCKCDCFQDFVSLYVTIKNKRIRELLWEGLNKINLEYQHINAGKSNINLDVNMLMEYYQNFYYLSTKESHMHTHLTEILLDESGFVKNCRNQYKIKQIRESGILFDYERDCKKAEQYDGYHLSPLTDSVCDEFGYIFSETDLKSYENLISRINEMDKFRKNFIQGSENFKGNIKVLTNTINSLR